MFKSYKGRYFNYEYLLKNFIKLCSVNWLKNCIRKVAYPEVLKIVTVLTNTRIAIFCRGEIFEKTEQENRKIFGKNVESNQMVEVSYIVLSVLFVLIVLYCLSEQIYVAVTWIIIGLYIVDFSV